MKSELNELLPILKAFDPITLEQINKVKLLDRMDSKYMFHADNLEEILSLSGKDYFILEIAGRKFARYKTTYFDTPDYEMYTRHHNGKLNRYKVRFRNYIDSGISFFEIKFKTNKGRTIKSRIKLDDKTPVIAGEAEKLLERKTNYKASSLIPVLQVNYNRMTLINRNMTERITIDFGLSYTHNDCIANIPNLIIAEVKQEKTDKSPFTAIMQEKRIKTVSLSKYCLGIASTVKDVKLNNLKPKVRYVNQLFS